MKNHLTNPEVLRRHIAILGKSGSGKTYAAKGAVEHMLSTGAQVVILDPTSAWWGLRLKRDGKTPAFDRVVVLGGPRGDLPLAGTPEQGAAVAELICSRGISCVLDTSDMTVGERTRWSMKFAETLYRRVRNVIHLVIDEAHEFAPQGSNPSPDAAQMLHAFKSIASGGRSRGLRLTMITQRPAKLHKDVLTCAETLVAMRVIAPQDREAVRDWVVGCGDPDKAKEVLGSLAQLKVGQGWLWCPELEIGPERANFPDIQTFDSSATPDGIREQVELAPIDHGELSRLLGDAAERARQDDPKALRERVRALEAQLAEGKSEPAQGLGEDEREALVNQGWLRANATLGHIRSELRPLLQSIEQHARAIVEHATPLMATVNSVQTLIETAEVVMTPSDRAKAEQVKAAPQLLANTKPNNPAPVLPPAAGGVQLSKAERAILTVLAQRQAGGPVSKATIAVQAGYSLSGGGFGNALGSLRSKGYADGMDPVRITAAGFEALGTYQPLPTGRALLQWWLGHRELGKAERAILKVLESGRAMSKAELAERTGYEVSGGGFGNAIGRLRTLKLLEDGRSGMLQASRELVS